MNERVEARRSSFLVSQPALIACLLFGGLAAFFAQGYLAGVLIFFFAMGVLARLWARLSMREVTLRVSSKVRGLFPGEEMPVSFSVRNNKFLPVVWLEVFCPLAKSLCMEPEETRQPDEWEQLSLGEEGWSEQLVGEKRFSFLLWYEQAEFTLRWTARCRGVYSMKGWRLRTGDGLGLVQVERRLAPEKAGQFYVYPKLVPVSPKLFLRNLWTAETGARGVMEDPTIIRSTRDYMVTDSMKQINWRLAARGLPLTVNVYEDILPRSVHFILDGESFGGPSAHWEELEETLSILASEVVRLSREQVRCGLSLSAGAWGEGRSYFGADSPHALLQAMACYEPLPPKWDGEERKYVSQPSCFDEGAIYDAAPRVGRFYYVAYNTDTLPESALLARMGRAGVTVLTHQDCRPYGGFETVCLTTLREGGEHG